MDIVPQLDVTTYSSQLLWFIFSFTILYLIMSKVILPKVEMIIQKRRLIVQYSVDNASNMYKLSEQELSKWESAIEEANGQAAKIVENAVKEVERMKHNLTNLMDEELVEIVQLSNERIDTLKKESHQGLIDISIEIASAYYKELLGVDFENREKLHNTIKLLYEKRL